MTLTETLGRRSDESHLTPDAHVRLCCQRAEEFERRGEYEAARQALGELWLGVGERPALEGLAELTAAELLLRVGTLSGWFASVQQAPGVQERARNLLSESSARLQALGATKRAAVALSELGRCYRLGGAYDEARVYYRAALEQLADTDVEEKAQVLVRAAVIEFCVGRYSDALLLLTEAEPLVSVSETHLLKGIYNNELGLVLTHISKGAPQHDYLDRAVLAHTAASVHFEEAGHLRYRASAENNLGFLLYTIGRLDEAYEHLTHAQRLFISLHDRGSVAQVDEVRARVLLTQGKVAQAEQLIRAAVRTLEYGDEQGTLAEALTTQGLVQARRGDHEQAQATLRHAADMAAQAGAPEEAGRALLTLFEASGQRLAASELAELYSRADGLLKDTQDAETIARLRVCARQTIACHPAAQPRAGAAAQTGAPATARSQSAHTGPPEAGQGPLLRRTQGGSAANPWGGFSLVAEVRAYEAVFVEQALKDAQGSISRAARLLGLTHHESLAYLLRTRHKHLLPARTPVKRRRRSIIKKP